MSSGLTMDQSLPKPPRFSSPPARSGFFAPAGCSVSLEGSGPSLGGGERPLPEQPPPQAGDAGQQLPQDASLAAIDAQPSDAGCSVDGRYAIRVGFDVSWEGTSFAGLVPVIS